MLIIVEGRDGVGKTSLVAKIVKTLSDMRASVISVREPTSRDCLKADSPIEAFAEDRLKQLREVVAPAHLSGTVVVSDRSIFSSLTYQNLDGSLDVEGHILQVNRQAVQLIRRFAASREIVILLLNPETVIRPSEEQVDENDRDALLSRRLFFRYPQVLSCLPPDIAQNVLTCTSYDEYDPLVTLVCQRARTFAERGAEQHDKAASPYVREWLAQFDLLG
jgi:thymidylate kinase